MRIQAAFENLKSTDQVTVYHGTDSIGMLEMLKLGVDATRVHSRSYNQGRERGIYVTPELKTAKKFGNWILEFDVRAKDLYPTKTWGLGRQRKADLRGLLEGYSKSFRPLVSFQLSENIEPQAMFIGYVPINKVKSIHMFDYGDSSKINKLTVKEAAEYLKSEAREWSSDMSAEDIIAALCKEHGAERSEIIEALNSYGDISEAVDSLGIPRKLGLKLKQYITTKYKAAASILKGNTCRSKGLNMSNQVVASDKVWVAKGPKGGNVSDPVATKALSKYIEQFGKAGKLFLYEAERENGMLSFGKGCKMLKGTLKEIIAQMKTEAIASTKVVAAIPKNVKPAEYTESLSKMHKYITNGDVKVLREGESGAAISGITADEKIKWETKSGRIAVYILDKSGRHYNIKETFAAGDQSRQFAVYIARLIGTTLEGKAVASVVTAEETLSARVCGQIKGDLKRIKSTIAAWKGKMPDEDYKAFVAYQKDVAGFIAKKYIPKMPEEYQKQVNAI